MPVAVVTDSTAYLPEGFATRHGVRVVPLHVLMDGTTGLDGVEVGAAELAKALADKRRVTTSRPTPDELAEVFAAELAAGASAVVSVHISRLLSGTWEAACQAAERVDPARVRVVDSRTTGMGLGFAVLSAARAAGAGATPSAVEAAATDTAAGTATYFAVETLDYLRRGGRIGAAAALLGTALAVKPVLHVSEGEIVPLEKVRTMNRAVARLAELATAAAGDREVRTAVHHIAASERAAALANRLDEALPRSPGCVVTELGAVIGAHTGPGVLGVVVVPV
ncbi:DegV family protein with EDD domain [Tamaricihabitans halophyticus]|uniref:DegV family protein with EDD domain n=1 Tax=Tamaricihabitans halophyticus TaxID=1262583 RepID=A0A4R2QXE8_9PSEU|nr:DegV family protein [Tamaricihabitans halophyticus]TCP54852.1 DegV family protein with EDD domain [Tamaricihabitans halophyticus]